MGCSSDKSVLEKEEEKNDEIDKKKEENEEKEVVEKNDEIDEKNEKKEENEEKGENEENEEQSSKKEKAKVTIIEKVNQNYSQKREEPETQVQENKSNSKIFEFEEEKEKQEIEKSQEDQIQEDLELFDENEENIVYNEIMFKNNNLTSFEKRSIDLQGSPNLLTENNDNKNKNKPKTKIKLYKKQKIIKKKKPFLITEVQSTPYQKIKIVINACSFFDEYMMPVWCPKDSNIKFRVEGQWRIDRMYDYTDSKGMKSNHCAGFNYGALIGRIGIGTQFMVADEMTIIVKEEGPLFLRPNLPKSMQIEPEGKLEVSVYDGIHMKIEEINNKINWFEKGVTDDNQNKKNEEEKNESCNIENSKDKKLRNSPKKSFISEDEKSEKELEQNLVIQFNNLRMNPSMFYKKYASFNTSLIWTKKFLEKLPKDGKASLDENENFYNFLDDYFKLPSQMQFRKILNRNNLSGNLKKLDEEIGYFMCDHFKASVKVKSKIIQRDNPMGIIMQYLLDRKFRPFIFDSRSQVLTIKIIKNYFYKSILVVMAIALDKDYSVEEP